MPSNATPTCHSRPQPICSDTATVFAVSQSRKKQKENLLAQNTTLGHVLTAINSNAGVVRVPRLQSVGVAWTKADQRGPKHEKCSLPAFSDKMRMKERRKLTLVFLGLFAEEIFLARVCVLFFRWSISIASPLYSLRPTEATTFVTLNAI